MTDYVNDKDFGIVETPHRGRVAQCYLRGLGKIGGQTNGFKNNLRLSSWCSCGLGLH